MIGSNFSLFGVQVSLYLGVNIVVVRQAFCPQPTRCSTAIFNLILYKRKEESTPHSVLPQWFSLYNHCPRCVCPKAQPPMGKQHLGPLSQRRGTQMHFFSATSHNDTHGVYTRAKSTYISSPVLDDRSWVTSGCRGNCRAMFTQTLHLHGRSPHMFKRYGMVHATFLSGRLAQYNVPVVWIPYGTLSPYVFENPVSDQVTFPCTSLYFVTISLALDTTPWL